MCDFTLMSRKKNVPMVNIGKKQAMEWQIHSWQERPWLAEYQTRAWYCVLAVNQYLDKDTVLHLSPLFKPIYSIIEHWLFNSPRSQERSEETKWKKVPEVWRSTEGNSNILSTRGWSRAEPEPARYERGLCLKKGKKQSWEVNQIFKARRGRFHQDEMSDW